MDFEHTIVDEMSGRAIRAVVTTAGPDTVVVVTGGSDPHVGSVVLAQPAGPGRSGVTTSVLTLPPHREEAIARPIAEALCRLTGGAVVVTAGIHEDGLDRNGIETYLELARRLADELAERIQ